MAKSNSGNDLVMRLVLENRKLTENLTKTQNQFTNFKNKVERQSQGVGVSFQQLAGKAGAIGIAIAGISSATEVFEGIKNSSQTLADKWNNNVGAMRDSTNEFFYAIGNGDFSSFTNGLTEIFNKARQTREILDQLGNAKISYDYVTSDLNQQMADKREIISNPDASIEEKDLALKQFDNLLTQKGEYIKNLGEDRIRAIKAQIAQSTLLSEEMIDMNSFDKILKFDITDSSQRDSLKMEMSALFDEYKQKMSDEKARYRVERTTLAPGQMEFANGQHQSTVSALTDEYKEAIIYNQLLNKFSDEQLVSLTTMVQQQRALGAELSNEQRQRNRLSKQVDTDRKKQSGAEEQGGSPKTPKTPELTRSQQWASLGFKDEEVEYTHGDYIADSVIANLAKKQLKFEGVSPVIVPLKFEGMDDEEIIENEAPTYISPEQHRLKELDSIQSATSSINSMLTATAGLLAQSGNEWGAWGLNAVANIATVIGQYASLIAMQMASGVAEQAKLIFPYNLAAMAGTAGAILSIIGSLPKFADGGIVQGNSKFGDKIFAMVNAGEMVLNTNQQSRLFSFFDGKSSPFSTGNANVVFRISGANLVGVLNNNQKKTSKLL